MLYVLLAAVCISAVGGLLFYLRRDNQTIGREEEKHKAIEGMLDDVYLAKKARDAIASSHDNDAARKLRQKYERR